MFRKLFGTRKVKPAGNHPTPTTVPPDGSSVLRIVHPGGTVESYYMAIAARTVLQKYPSSVLAKPDVFRRPWEATIRPEVILVPGQKFFIVPRRTLKKLRRTIPKPVSEIISGYITACEHKDDFSGSESFSRQGDTGAMSIVKWKGKSGRSKSNGRNSGRRVRFLGVDSDSSVSVEKKAMIAAEEDPNKRAGSRVGAEKRTVRHMVTWQPQLTAITELHGMNE